MRPLLALLLMSVLSLGQAGPALSQESPAQREADKASAAEFAYYISQLESAGRFSDVYALLHPDALAFIPESAVVGWYRDNIAPKGPQPVQVTFVLLVPWQWGVTGATYFDTAAVTYVQPYADGSYVEETVHFAKDGNGNWRWFFGRTAEFVQGQIDRYYAPPTAAPPPKKAATGVPKPPPAKTRTPSPSRPTATATATATTKLDPDVSALYADINDFWGRTLLEDWYTSPGLRTFVAPADTGCGPVPETQGPFYCPLDQRIYLNVPVVNDLDDRDFILGMVIAHEWGHHLETLVGYQTNEIPTGNRQVYSVQMELAADCLAGVWAASAYLEGGADEAELYDALVTMANLGDGVGSPLLGPDAHGSPQQRQDAFAGGLWYGDPLLCQQTYLGG